MKEWLLRNINAVDKIIHSEEIVREEAKAKELREGIYSFYGCDLNEEIENSIWIAKILNKIRNTFVSEVIFAIYGIVKFMIIVILSIFYVKVFRDEEVLEALAKMCGIIA